MDQYLHAFKIYVQSSSYGASFALGETQSTHKQITKSERTPNAEPC